MELAVTVLASPVSKKASSVEYRVTTRTELAIRGEVFEVEAVKGT